MGNWKFDVRCWMLDVPLPSREGSGGGLSCSNARLLGQPALSHPTDSARQSPAAASHGPVRFKEPHNPAPTGFFGAPAVMEKPHRFVHLVTQLGLGIEIGR